MGDVELLYDVIIVGAGLSGLAAATEILSKDNTATVKILEASDRVGGRNFLDKGTDKGSGYIGPTQDRIMRIIDLLGLKIYKVHTEGKSVQYVEGKASKFSGTIPPLSPFALLDLNAALVEIDRITEKINLEQPHLTPNAEELDTTTLAEFARRKCWTAAAKSMLRVMVSAILGKELCEVSMLFFAWYVRSSGGIKRICETSDGAQDSKVKGGTGSISIELAKRLPADCIELNTPVSSIDYSSDNSVTVIAGNKLEKYQGKTLILAIPPHQHLRISFFPQLSPNRVASLSLWPMCAYTKTFLFYSRPWWREKGFSGSLVGDKGITTTVMDDSKSGRWALMGFVLSNEAVKWMAKTPEERKHALAQHYAKVFDAPEALDVLEYQEKQWSEDPWACGALAAPVPGALVKFPGEAFRSQIAPHVFIAGTEAAKLFVGYMDGAVEAGERSGRNALVRLGKLPQSQFDVVSRPDPSTQLPFVKMELSFVEKRLLPSVGQALSASIFVTVAIAVGVFLHHVKR
jgi:monoamine oxidase